MDYYYLKKIGVPRLDLGFLEDTPVFVRSGAGKT